MKHGAETHKANIQQTREKAKLAQHNKPSQTGKGKK